MAKTKIHTSSSWYLVVGLLVVAVVAFFAYKNYCDQLVPKQVSVKYTEQEPYTIYEAQTRTQHVREDNCDRRSECSCTGKFLFIGYCTSCDCQITEQVPVTKYREVEKTRVETQMVKRCG